MTGHWSLAGCVRRLQMDRRAVAAVEFALIAPVMVILLVGTIELVNLLRIQLKVNMAADQLVEMVAGASTVTEAASGGTGGSLTDMCTAAAYNLLPYGSGKMSAAIASITVTPNLVITADWATDKACPTQVTGSASLITALTAAADTPRSLFTLDGTPSASGGTVVKGYSAISTQVTYVYSNIIPFLQAPSITFTALATARPRSNATIPCSYGTGTPASPCSVVY